MASPGDRFGRYLVVAEAPRRRGNARVLCRCDCGTEREVFTASLEQGRSRSCGCLMAELSRARRTSHGMSGHQAHKSWSTMKARSTPGSRRQRERPTYVGISHDPRWDSFEVFWADMGPTWFEGAVLSRLGDVGDYGPENCRWITREQNSRELHSNRTARLDAALAENATLLQIIADLQQEVSRLKEVMPR